MQTEPKIYWALKLSGQSPDTHESRQLFQDERGPVLFSAKSKAITYLRKFEYLNLIRPAGEHNMRLIKITVTLRALTDIEEQTVPADDEPSPPVYNCDNN